MVKRMGLDKKMDDEGILVKYTSADTVATFKMKALLAIAGRTGLDIPAGEIRLVLKGKNLEDEPWRRIQEFQPEGFIVARTVARGGGKRAHSSTSKAKHERDMEDKDSIMLKETKDIQLHMKGLSPQAQQDQEFIDIMNDLERVMESIRVHPTEAVITLINQLDVKSLTKMMSMVGNKNADFFYNHSGRLVFNVHTSVLTRKIEDATIIMGAFFKVFRLAYFGRYMDDEGRVKHVSCVNDLSVLFQRVGAAAAAQPP